MERRAFLPKLALLIGAAAVACREAATAPFRSRSGAVALIVKPDGSWVLGRSGQPLIASGGASDPVPAGFGPFSGLTGKMKLPDCDTYCAKLAGSCCDSYHFHCGLNPYTGSCDALCTC